jgi:hypothetical protein
MIVTQVFTDKSEYSRYHSALSVITATITISSPVVGATLNVALFRSDGYGAVSTKPLLLTIATQYQVTFNLTTDSYDAKGIYRAKQGDYTIQVTDSTKSLLGASAMLAVSIVPVDEIRRTWATGVTFLNYEELLPKIQPRVVTGVVVTEIPINHYKGAFPLKFKAIDKSLSWNNGVYVATSGLQPQQILLLDQKQTDYILIQVDPLNLPTTDQTEVLIIDNAKLSDRDIIRQLRLATEWVQQRIITKVEPELLDTNATGFVDDVAMPQTYYSPSRSNKWMSLNIPYPNLIDLESLSGYLNQSKSADIPRQWYVWNEKTGIVELVPNNSAQVSWTFYNGFFGFGNLLNFKSIPGFWHYRITCGLRDLNNERAIVREAIAKKAVYELLNSAGSAYRAGYASQSNSRDGVSQSEGYTASATYGTYGGHFTSYKEWLAEEIPRMKKRYCGIMFTSI